MKNLKLENSDLIVLVDDEDFERLSIFKWYDFGRKFSPSIQRNDGYKHLSLSSEIMNTKEIMYDHKNRNALNYQKENLRKCNYSTNSFNRDKPISPFSTSQYKGVHWNKKCKKWHTQIMLNGKNIYLGLHKIEEDAAKAYDTKAKELFKEFACLNFPDNLC